jgi:CheY-like chemotaxis protein
MGRVVAEMIPKTVLYVEDDPNDLLLLKRTLEHAQLRLKVFHVFDATAAIQWLQGWGIFQDRTRYPLPDVLLTDLHMQRAHGFDLIKWLRAQPALSKMPVLVLSTSDELYDIRRASELGATAFFTKGRSFPQLVHWLREYQHWPVV